jgi:hypothetical protein
VIPAAIIDDLMDSIGIGPVAHVPSIGLRFAVAEADTDDAVRVDAEAAGMGLLMTVGAGDGVATAEHPAIASATVRSRPVIRVGPFRWFPARPSGRRQAILARATRSIEWIIRIPSMRSSVTPVGRTACSFDGFLVLKATS